MNVWAARYVLRPRRRVSARAGSAERVGALIRSGDGFGDIHPWPELGDPPLEAHLDSIATRVPTPLARRALDCAAIDGEARRGGYSLFEDVTIPPSHFLALPGDAIDCAAIAAAGFDRIKVKVTLDSGDALDRIARELLETPLRLRLDFNAGMGLADLHAFLEALPPRLVERIEFLEDPVPADAPAWREVRQRWGLAIAADREKPDPSCWDVAVIKPASEADVVVESALAAGKPVVFTSAMDHPLGQLWAAWTAAVLAARHPGRVLTCGLLTHTGREPAPFIESLGARGPELVPPEGTGLGLDGLLAGLAWEKIA